MNIAFIHTIFPGGGAERISRDIAMSINAGFPSKYNFFIFAQIIIEEALTEEYNTPFKLNFKQFFIINNKIIYLQLKHMLKSKYA